MRPNTYIDGVPLITSRITTSDVHGMLGNLSAVTVDGNVCMSALVTCEDNAIRFALGNTIPTTELGHLLLPNQSIKLSNPAAVRTFKYVNAVAGNDAVIQITFEFATGV